MPKDNIKLFLFDLSCAQPSGNIKYHGGGEYTKTVFGKFIDDYSDESIAVCFNQDKFLDDWLTNIITKFNIKTYDVKSIGQISNLINQLAQCYEEITYYCGIAYGYEDVTFPKNVTSLGTFHGIRLIEKPYDRNVIYYMNSIYDYKTLFSNVFFKKKLLHNIFRSYRESMDKFNVIVTVSEYSKYSIMHNIPEIGMKKNIIRLYPPLKHLEYGQREISSACTSRFILVIGGDRWLKNSLRGLLAIDSLYSKGYLKEIRTKIVGDLPTRIKNKLKNKENFDIYGYLETDELEKMYQDCDTFFYPTLNEGFGSPPLEAMKYGKTCVVSSVCSLTEVYGNAVYYCNPYDIQEMQNKILQAHEKKIEKSVISERVALVAEWQSRDLKKLVDIIHDACSK